MFARIPVLSTSRSRSSKNLRTTLFPRHTSMPRFLKTKSKSLPSLKAHAMTFMVASTHVKTLFSGMRRRKAASA